VLLAAPPAGAAEAQLTAAARDAGRLVGCMVRGDVRCVLEWSYAPGYVPILTELELELEQLLGQEKLQRRLIEPDTGPVRTYFHGDRKPDEFDLGQPEMLFADSGLLFTFVPYVKTRYDYSVWLSGEVVISVQRREMDLFLIGVSVDDGASWRFVDAAYFVTDRLERRGLVRLQEDSLRQMFPDSETIQLPEIQRIRADFIMPTVRRTKDIEAGSFGLHMIRGTGGGSVGLILLLRGPAESDLRVEVEFENPADSRSPMVVQDTIARGSELLDVQSPFMSGFDDQKSYRIKVEAFDAASGSLHFRQRLFLNFEANRQTMQWLRGGAQP
jgi:hypothetical protein